jgi:protein-tyrosine-phosphatase
MAGAALSDRLPQLDVATAGTLSVDGQPMSWRTTASLRAVGLEPPRHRSRQAGLDDVDRATLVIGLAPEHVEWVRREHPHAAAYTSTLKRLVRDLADDDRPLADRVAELHLATVTLEEWEEVVDPGGGEADVFIQCAHEVVALVDALASRLAD